MADADEKLEVHVNVEITAGALSTIVDNAKNLAGKHEKGGYHVDTADMVGRMISLFLEKNDFEAFVGDINNYPEPKTP